MKGTFIGLDPSTTSSGVFAMQIQEGVVVSADAVAITPKHPLFKRIREEREHKFRMPGFPLTELSNKKDKLLLYTDMASTLLQMVKIHLADHPGGPIAIGLEGVSMASSSSSAKDLAGLWWLVYSKLATANLRGAKVVVIPPFSLKGYILGYCKPDKSFIRKAMDYGFLPFRMIQWEKTKKGAIQGKSDMDDAAALASFVARKLLGPDSDAFLWHEARWVMSQFKPLNELKASSNLAVDRFNLLTEEKT